MTTRTKKEMFSMAEPDTQGRWSIDVDSNHQIYINGFDLGGAEEARKLIKQLQRAERLTSGKG